MKRIFLCFIVLMCSCFGGFGQANESKLDVLRSKLTKETNRDTLIKIKNAIAIELKNNNSFEEAIAYLHSNINHCTGIKYEVGQAESYLILGQIYINSGSLDSADFYLSKSIKIFSKAELKNKLSRAFFLTGILYQSKSDHTNHLRFTRLALQKAEECKDYQLLNDCYSSLSMYYLDQNKYKEALENAKKSSKYALLTKNAMRINQSYFELAESYRLLKDTVMANTYFKKSFAFFSDTERTLQKAWILTNWANLKQTDEAIKMRLEAQRYWNEIGQNAMSSHNSGLLGELYMRKYHDEKDPSKKASYLTRAGAVFSQIVENSHAIGDVVGSINFNKSLADYYKIKQNYEKAYWHLETSYRLNDSLNSQEIKNKLAQLETQKELDIRDKEIQLNKLTISAKENQKRFYISGLVILAGVGMLLFYQNTRRKKTNRELLRLNAELDQANKTKTRFFSILNHDLRSPVANLIHFLQLQQESPSLLDEETVKRMQNKTISGAENLLISMEDILLWTKGQMENFKTQPKTISVAKLYEDTMKVFSGYQNIAFRFNDPENLNLFTDENFVKTIIRNLTSNSINAFVNTPTPKITWNAFVKNGKTCLSIADNGNGAETEKFKAFYDDSQVVGIQSGLGLHLIRDLAKAINCDVEVESKLGVGTTIVLVFKD